MTDGRPTLSLSMRNRSHAVRKFAAAFANLTKLSGDEQSILLILAVVIGIAAGGAVTIFYKTIDVVQRTVLHAATHAGLPDVLLIPVVVGLGLAACRALVHWGAGGSAGENIPDVMYRVAVKGGVIHSVPVLVKTAAAAIVIGTGGSVGAEGPVVVLGAAAASRIGRWLRSSPNRLRTLVGCGAAAGISAAFNAPIAGVIFGIEKILGGAGGMALAPFVVASILAATVGRAVFGDHPVIALPAEFGIHSGWELLLYVALGFITGTVAVLYSRGVWKMQDVFRRVPSAPLQVMLGAAVLGGLDFVFRADLWGHGHESLNIGVVTSRTASFLVALALAKLIATAVTFGAGGTGGVFTPALFIGGTLGGACGVAAGMLLPAWHVAPGAVALVGMGGLVAGATHAPLTAIMMVFEMTRDYGLILPLMLTSVVAYVIARRLYPESIYTEWLVRRGVVLSHGADAAVLARTTVAECFNPEPMTLREEADLHEIVASTSESRQTAFPVVSVDGRLVGMLGREAVREALENGEHIAQLLVAGDLIRGHADRVTPEDSLLTALRRLGANDVDQLPVVDAATGESLLGVVSRQDLMAAYERELTKERH
ncbi:MAG TPA: chloride channel protein [Gemmatimonadales bacterium]|nr:chloride channel protein [Gemmatimonadales bacterium]